MWCVLKCSGNLFTSSTLFGKVNTHFYLIDYELHVSDTDVFFLSPFSLFSYFCYQTYYKKENSIEVWTIIYTMDVQLLRINFSFEKKMQISTLFWASLSFLGKMVIFAGRWCQKLKKNILHSAEGGIYRWLCVYARMHAWGVGVCVRECARMCVLVHVTCMLVTVM